MSTMSWGTVDRRGQKIVFTTLVGLIIINETSFSRDLLYLIKSYSKLMLKSQNLAIFVPEDDGDCSTLTAHARDNNSQGLDLWVWLRIDIRRSGSCLLRCWLVRPVFRWSADSQVSG